MHLARDTRPSTVVVLVCMALLACSPAQEVQVRPVKVVRVHQQLAGQTAYGTGEIRARYDTALGFLVGGRIIERSAEVGKIVKAGDVLARLDEEVQRANVNGAEASLTGAEAAQTQAASAARRAQSLLRIGAGTAEAEELSVSALATAAANVQAARTNLSNARQQLSYTLLRASTNGVVTAVRANVGQVVQVGQVVVEIVQPQEREAVFAIGESTVAIAAAHPDIPVLVALASEPKITVVGHVRYIAPNADPQTRTYEARISLPNAPLQMALGTTVTGSISDGVSSAISIPLGALFHRGQSPAVWKYDAKKQDVELVSVRVSRYDDNTVFLSSGVSDGAIIVTAGVNSLYEGEHVRLLNEATP